MIITLEAKDDKAKENGDVGTDSLAKLPDEILMQIFEAVGRSSRKSLCNVSRLNKKYHKLSDAILYKSILFNTPELHLTFSESLGRRPRRGSAIHEIKLSYPSSELSHLALDAPVHNSYIDPKRFDSLSRTLSIMSNLEKLDIAVPDVLLHGIGALFNGPFDLACLKTCSLFYQCANDAYWDLRENIHIFAHPTLETLIIRRAKLDERGFDFIERPHETALKSLHLVECDINDDALGDVLELPEALEEFVMTQTEEPEPELEESSDSLSDYIVALKSQAEFLTTITIDSPSLYNRKTLRLREFGALKTLRLNWDHQLFGKSGKKPRLHSVGFPPEMETLEFFNELGTDREVNDLFLTALETKDIIARNWKTMIAVEGDDGFPQDIKAACKAAGLQLDIIGAMDSDTEDERDEEENDGEDYEGDEEEDQDVADDDAENGTRAICDGNLGIGDEKAAHELPVETEALEDKGSEQEEAKIIVETVTQEMQTDAEGNDNNEKNVEGQRRATQGQGLGEADARKKANGNQEIKRTQQWRRYTR